MTLVEGIICVGVIFLLNAGIKLSLENSQLKAEKRLHTLVKYPCPDKDQ